MNTFLKFREDVFESLLTHLLPKGTSVEQAAFLYATARQTEEDMHFEVTDIDRLQPDDFEVQHEFYLELRDTTRARVIKRANDLRTSLVEVHSHPGGLPAAFSASDLSGLRDTVRLMWWRLKKRPYAAIVVAQRGFDALVWLESPDKAQALTGLIAGDRVYRPTNASLRHW